VSVGHRVDPTQAAAEERVGAWMARALVAIAALAGLGLVLPGGGWLDGAAILAITALPIARVAWLARRWWAIGDRRYAAVAIGLLGLVALGPLLALR